VIASLQARYATETSSGRQIRHNNVWGYFGRGHRRPSRALDRMASRKDLSIGRRSRAHAVRTTELASSSRRSPARRIGARDRAFDLRRPLSAHRGEEKAIRRVRARLPRSTSASALGRASATKASAAEGRHELAFRIKAAGHPVVEQALRSEGQSLSQTIAILGPSRLASLAPQGEGELPEPAASGF